MADFHSPVCTDVRARCNDTSYGADVAEPLLDRLLSIDEVRILTSLSKQSIYRKMANCTFPKCISIAENKHGQATRVAWSAVDIQEWRRACRSKLRNADAATEVRAA